MSRKRKTLTLDERVAVLKKIDLGKSCHGVAQELGVGTNPLPHQPLMEDRLFWETTFCWI